MSRDLFEDVILLYFCFALLISSLMWYTTPEKKWLFKGAVSRNSAKLGNYKMPVKLRETKK